MERRGGAWDTNSTRRGRKRNQKSRKHPAKRQETMNVTSRTTFPLNSQEPCEFEEVAVFFSQEEWDCLREEEKELYRNVMMENYQTLCSLGRIHMTPHIVSMIVNGEEPFLRGHWLPTLLESPVLTDLQGGSEKTITRMSCVTASTPESVNAKKLVRPASPTKSPDMERKGHTLRNTSRETPSPQDLYRTTENIPAEQQSAALRVRAISCDGDVLTDLSTRIYHACSHGKEEPSSCEKEPSVGFYPELTRAGHQFNVIKQEAGLWEEHVVMTVKGNAEHKYAPIKEEETLRDEEHLPEIYMPSEYPSVCIKQEPTSQEGGSTTDTYRSTECIEQDFLPTPLKEEPGSSEGMLQLAQQRWTEHPCDLKEETLKVTYTPSIFTQTEQPRIPFMKEPTARELKNLIDPKMHPPSDHTYTERPSTYSFEETNRNLTDLCPPTAQIQVTYACTNIMEEPISWEGEHLTEVYPPREHTQTDYPLTYIMEETALCEGDLQEIAIYSPPEHTQTDNAPPGFQKESSLDQGENLMDLYPQAEHASIPDTEEPTSCEGHLEDVYILTGHSSTKQRPHECAYTYIIEDSLSSCDDGKLTDNTISGLSVYPSSHTEKKWDTSEGHLRGDDVCQSIKHTQTGFVSVDTAEEPGEDNSSAVYSFIEHTQANIREYKPQNSETQSTSSRKSETTYSAKQRPVNQAHLLYLRSKLNPHVIPRNTTFSCLKCDENLPWMYQLEDHEKTHVIFSYSNCKKSSDGRSHLADRPETHADGKALKCPGCTQCFDSESEYVTHLRAHVANSIIITGHSRRSPGIEQVVSTKDYPENCVSMDTTSSEEVIPDNVAINIEDKRSHSNTFKHRSHRADRGHIQSGGKAHGCLGCTQCSDCESQNVTHIASSSGGLDTEHSVIDGQRKSNTEKLWSKLDYCMDYASVDTTSSDNQPHSDHKPFELVMPTQAEVSCPSQTPFHTNEYATPHSFPVKPDRGRPHCASKEKKKHLTCLECGEGFRFNSELLLHMKCHTREKNPTCAVCGKRFGSFVDLVLHQKSSHRRSK